MPNVTLGISNDGFRAALKGTVEDWAKRAASNAHNGPGARRNAETLTALAQFIGSMDPEDPRFLALEFAHGSRGLSKTTYEPTGKGQRLLASAGASLNGVASSNDHLVNEFIACEIASTVDQLRSETTDALNAKQRAEEQRDQLHPVVEQRDSLMRQTERQSQQILELENQLREARDDVEYLRAALPAEKKPKAKAAA